MTISDQVIDFYKSFPKTDLFDNAIQLHNPFDAPSRRTLIEYFYSKYFNDEKSRVHVLGINPSRLSKSSTGINYTDGYSLEAFCEIPNDFSKTRELTSEFFYEMITQAGGVDKFYANVFPWAALPVAITKEGSYSNYYEFDRKEISELVRMNIAWLEALPRVGKLIVLGIGENKQYIEGLPEESEDPKRQTIAKILGVTGRSVRNYLRRAEQKLREWNEK